MLSQAKSDIEQASAVDALESLRVSLLGKKGSVSALLATMGKLDPEERKVKGPQFNGLKEAVTAAIAARKLSCAEVMAAYLDHIDIHNPRVNAIVALQDREALLAQARAAIAECDKHIQD